MEVRAQKDLVVKSQLSLASLKTASLKLVKCWLKSNYRGAPAALP